MKDQREINDVSSSPKDWVEDFDYENGRYTCFCAGCDNWFYGHKRRVICKVCDTSPNQHLLILENKK